MKIRYNLIIICIVALCVTGAVSCSQSERVSKVRGIVINELMASNRTGLLTDSGKTADWIEIKNLSKDTVDLEGCRLEVIKAVPDTVAGPTNGKKNKKEDKDSVKSWTFPEVKIAGGECLVIFAEKNKDKKKKKKQKEDDDEDADEDDEQEIEKQSAKVPAQLTTGFKLPKDGGTVRFMAPDGTVISEVKYDKLAPDQSLALQPDSTYLPTFWQSPGFENDRAGYERASAFMDSQRKDPLKIWELMSRAPHSYENWVELKNTGTTDIDLAAYSLSKKSPKDDPWKLPSKVLKPGEIVTIQLAGKRAANNPLKAPFKLGNAETIILSKDGKFVDGICARQTLYGGSIGRMEGKQGWYYFLTPTKGSGNSPEGRPYISEKPSFDFKPGVYAKNDTLTIHLADTTRKVHYTLDGSLPSASSPVLKDSLRLTKSTVIRSFAEGDSLTLRSGVATASYILGVDHSLPVMNIAVNNGDLYNFSNGIYANGPGFDEEWPHKGANFWKSWTKRAHVEFFDNREGAEGFSTDCGLKIFGGFSRADAKKSFRLKFRGMYGNQEIEYDFFGDGQPLELEDLVIRAGGQDYNRCMIRDEFFTSLMQGGSDNILTQKYRPVALYINGGYFGLYFLREKVDRNFVARKLNLPTNDSVNIIMSRAYNEEGPADEFKRMRAFVSSHDMTDPANYDYIKKNIDLIGLIDYKIGQIYSGNADVGNIRYVRSTAPGSDRKWHYVFYDLDATWVGYKPSAAFYLTTGPEASEANVAYHNLMISRLLPNKEFRALFLQRLGQHLATTLSPANANKVFDDLVALIKPEMERNCKRWPQLSYNQWEKNIADFKVKLDNKPKVMLDDIRVLLSVTQEENKKYFGKLGY